MKKLIIAILMQISLSLFPLLSLCGQELSESDRAWLDHIESLRFSEVDWIPLSYASEYPEYRGIIADYLDILSERTGLELVFVQSETWQEVLDRYGNQEIDLIPAISTGDYMDAEVLLTEPYTSFPLVIVTRPDVDFISNTSELKGKRVGAGKGYTSYNFLKNNYPEIELVATDNVAEGLRLVERGKIDAFVGHLAVVRDNINKYHLNLNIAGKTEYVFEHRMGLPPEHGRTVAIFNKVLAQITPEKHNHIYNKWIRLPTDRVDYTPVWKILMTALVIIFGFIIWNRKIMAQKEQILKMLGDLENLKAQLEGKNRELYRLARNDRLTGLYNRFKLDEALEYEAGSYARFNRPFGIILMDLDFFKAVNDSYGHPVGDEVLMSLSRLLEAHIRKTDILGRWGGEEFLVICPGTDKRGTEELAEKLRENIECHDFPVVRSCTASFGVSVFHSGDDLVQLLRRADEALYTAKNNGRNQVVAK